MKDDPKTVQDPAEEELTPLPEKLNFAPKPFTRYKAAELVICGIAVILGLCYLYSAWMPLDVLLPIYCVCFAAIPFLRWLEARSQGAHGLAVMLPILCWALLALAVIAAAISYFAR